MLWVSRGGTRLCAQLRAKHSSTSSSSGSSTTQSGDSATAKLLRKLIASLHKVPKQSQAVHKVLLEMQRLLAAGHTVGTKCYNSVLGFLVTKRAFDPAITLLQQMHLKGIPRSRATYNTLILMHSRRGDQHAVQRTLKEMEVNGHAPTPITYLGLLVAYSKVPDFEKIQTTMGKMCSEGHRPTIRHLNTALSGCRRDNEVAFIMRLMHLYELSPTSFTWGILLNICALNKDLEGAHLVVARMRALGAPMDAMAYSALAKVYKEVGDTNGAMRVLESAVVAGKTTPHIFCTVVKAAAGLVRREGDEHFLLAERAYSLALVSGCQESFLLYIKMLEMYKSTGSTAKIESLLCEMRAHRLSSNHPQVLQLLDRPDGPR